MAQTHAHAAHSSNTRGSLAFNLSIITLMAALAGLAFAYYLDLAGSRTPDGPALSSTASVIEKTIAGQRLAIPSDWFRFVDQKVDGFSERIDLAFRLPLGGQGSSAVVDATLVPRSRVRPSDRLLDSVYLHQFDQSQVDGPLGLIGKPLRSMDGFQNETVWYDPVSQSPFVAKCMPVIEDPSQSSCMRTVQVTEQVAVTYVFDAGLLEHWQHFDAEAQRWLSRIGGI